MAPFRLSQKARRAIRDAILFIVLGLGAVLLAYYMGWL